MAHPAPLVIEDFSSDDETPPASPCQVVDSDACFAVPSLIPERELENGRLVRTAMKLRRRTQQLQARVNAKAAIPGARQFAATATPEQVERLVAKVLEVKEENAVLSREKHALKLVLARTDVPSSAMTAENHRLRQENTLLKQALAAVLGKHKQFVAKYSSNMDVRMLRHSRGDHKRDGSTGETSEEEEEEEEDTGHCEWRVPALHPTRTTFRESQSPKRKRQDFEEEGEGLGQDFEEEDEGEPLSKRAKF